MHLIPEEHIGNGVVRHRFPGQPTQAQCEF